MKDKKSMQNSTQTQQLFSALTSNQAISQNETDLHILSDHEEGSAQKKIPFYITHTRAEAIKVGFLIEVSQVASEWGFTLPVALTSALWKRCIAGEKDKLSEQEQQSRLKELLHQALIAVTHSKVTPRCYFTFPAVGEKEGVFLDLMIYKSPGYVEPSAITIMLFDED